MLTKFPQKNYSHVDSSPRITVDRHLCNVSGLATYYAIITLSAADNMLSHLHEHTALYKCKSICFGIIKVFLHLN